MSHFNAFCHSESLDEPFTQRPTEILQNPYANANRGFDAQMRLFDEELIKKYNRSGPRYTCYPTALEFVPIETGAEEAILNNRDERVPLSLYFHIPFCRTLCY